MGTVGNTWGQTHLTQRQPIYLVHVLLSEKGLTPCVPNCSHQLGARPGISDHFPFGASKKHPQRLNYPADQQDDNKQ